MLVFNYYQSTKDNGELYRMTDSPRVMSSASSCTSRVLPQCVPSTSFATSTVIDLNQHINSSILAGYQNHLLQHSNSYNRVLPSHPHPTHESLIKMHNAPVIVEPEIDIDVVGLTDSSKNEMFESSELSPESKEEKTENIETTTVITNSNVPSQTFRPTVIVEKHGRSTTVRRSVSNASNIEPDVHEHFRRSLSGKWPRRSKTEDEKSRASPFRRHPSFNSNSSVQVINSKNIDIEDHFRKALGLQEYEAWKKKRDQEDM